MDKAGGESSGGVEEDGEVAATQGLSQFWGPLLSGINGDFSASELIAELASEVESNCVVAANGVATSEDEGAGNRKVICGAWPAMLAEKSVTRLGWSATDGTGG